MKKSMIICMALLITATWAKGQDIAGKKPENKPSNIINTMMLEKVEELTEEFNQVEVTYKKKKPQENKVEEEVTSSTHPKKQPEADEENKGGEKQ